MYPYPCGINDMAVVATVDGKPVWQETPDATHVSEEMAGYRFLLSKYRLTDWCVYAEAWHAERTDRLATTRGADDI